MPPAPQPSMLESRVEVETPEQVVLTYTIAGVGSRAAAAAIDMLLCVGAMVAVVLLSGLAGAAGADIDLSGEWLVAVLVIGQFLIIWGYHALCEALRDGQTFGKRWLGLRVVLDGGRGVTLGAAAARNLVRFVDMQPAFLYVVGIVAAASSRRGRRIGDIVAGTIVVRERAVATAADDTRAATRRPERASVVATNEGMPAAAPLVPLLADDLYDLLDRYMARRAAIAPERRAALAAQLAARLRAVVPAERVALAARSESAWLAALHEREREARSARRAGATSSVPSNVTSGAPSALGTPALEFAAQLATVQRRGGLRSMPEDEVSAFVARYRELATDLARARTAARGELGATYALERLVAAGHNLLYRRTGTGLDTAWRFVADDVPAEVRRSWRPIALAALLLFGPAAVSFEAARRDLVVAEQLVPSGLIDRAEEGVVRARSGRGGYLPEREAKLRGPVMASFIMTNNVQVTFAAFALGVTAGVGTVLSLVFNGVAALGAPLGLYASKGILTQILGFVLPHGVLELSAICIAGGAGLLLATAMLLPGARTRRDALVDEGRRALHLIAASSLLLVVAGVIEGNVSPRALPLGTKAAVSAVTAVLLALYLVPRRRAAAARRQSAPRALISR